MPRKVKDPAVRARRNRASTAAELPAPDAPELKSTKAPPLNAQLLGIKGAIRAPVQRWWRVIWRSPMAPRWLESDIEGLYLIALLRQQVIELALQGKTVATLEAEIRQQEGRFGLDVLARRRLDWRIEGKRTPDEPAAKETPVPAPPPARPDFDPRSMLRVLS